MGRERMKYFDTHGSELVKLCELLNIAKQKRQTNHKLVSLPEEKQFNELLINIFTDMFKAYDYSPNDELNRELLEVTLLIIDEMSS